MEDIVLENGYNTDYMYSVIIALFVSSHEFVDLIVNTNYSNPVTYYIQEFIKMKFIYHLRQNKSITSNTINKFRMLLYSCGWSQESKDIVYPHCVELFYKFLVSDLFNYQIKIVCNDTDRSTALNLDKIEYEQSFAQCSNLLEHNYLYDSKFNSVSNSMFTVTDSNNYNSNKIIKLTHIKLNNDHILNTNDKIVSVSSMLKEWEKKNLNFSFKFDPIPYLLPIYIDVDNNILVDIMHAIQFNVDSHKNNIWIIQSLICKDTNYYAVTYDNTTDLWTCYSDQNVPSNVQINMHDPSIVKKIMKEVIFIFYIMADIQ